MTDFAQYRRKQIAELRPYVPGERLDGVSISQPDSEAGSPKDGDMIARNPKNHADQWLVAAQYFKDNFDPLAALSAGGAGAVKMEMVWVQNLKGFIEGKFPASDEWKRVFLKQLSAPASCAWAGARAEPVGMGVFRNGEMIGFVGLGDEFKPPEDTDERRPIYASPPLDRGEAGAQPVAMRHLGHVLMMLAELHEDDRTDAFEAALSFYNEHNPTAQIAPDDGYETRLAISSPLSRAVEQFASTAPEDDHD